MDRFFVRRHLGHHRLKQLANAFAAKPVKQVLHGRLSYSCEAYLLIRKQFPLGWEA